ncbi:MAG: hypothetical protein ACYSU0_21855, partial [Planctomycetota bacterium]
SSANGLEDAAKRPLLRAADHYESLVRELEEGRATAPSTEGRWTAELRSAQADVLGRALAFDRQAVAEIRKALAAARVERDGDRLVLRNFPTGTDYQVRGFGVLLALRDCLACEGVEVDWSDLLGYSGDAFGCDGMAYDSVRAHDVLMEAARAYGFEGDWSFGPEEPPFAALDRTLAEGRPAMVGGAFFGTSCLYFPVVVGRDRAAGRFLMAGIGEKPKWVPAPAEDGVLGRWNGQCPWATGAKTRDGIKSNWHGSPRFILKGRGGRPAERERFTNALRLGVASYRAAPLEMYWGGERWTCALGREYLVKWPEELRKWAKRLRERGPVDPNDGDPPRPGYFNPTAVSVRRRAAAAFLRKRARALPEAARPHIEAAAASYEKSVEAAERMFDALYAVDELRDLDALGRLRVRLYIGEGKRAAAAVAEYAKENPALFTARAALVRRMTETFADDAAVEEACRLAGEVLKSDDAAVAEIEKALAALDVERAGVLLKGQKHGFRVDPMKWVNESESLQAALVRRHVFKSPLAGDDELLAGRVKAILAEQREGGWLGDRGHDHAAKLMELAECGASRDDPRVRKAIEASLRGKEDEPGPWIRGVRALCMFGEAKRPEVAKAVRAMMENQGKWNSPWKLCPWGQPFYINALWSAREAVDTTELVASVLAGMADGLNEAGTVGYKDPWGLVWSTSLIDLPEA